ncbi:MAG: hypothetical protein GY786_07275, partial [Proteobacteria bacterium]|nr:hypothetical protein [Pseudomonadota bacterium]
MSIPGTVSKLWSFYKLKTAKKLSAVFIQLIEALVRRWVLGDPSIIRGIFTSRYRENQKKQIVLDNLGSEVRTIFFVFRDLHILDWFTPIDRALTAEYPGKYQIIYIDYGSTLKPVG